MAKGLFGGLFGGQGLQMVGKLWFIMKYLRIH